MKEFYNTKKPQALAFLQLGLLILIISKINFAQEKKNWINGNLIQFNDNGAWCWFQDERAVVDTVLDKIIIGSVASKNGIGGTSRRGYNEAVIVDLHSRISQKYSLEYLYEGDDHHAPAFLILPDGKYLTMYAAHNGWYSYSRIFNGNQWGTQRMFDWHSMSSGTDVGATYSNLFYLADENKIYNIARSYARSPNLMVSRDGETWTYGGLLTQPDTTIGYVNGYFKYSGNGKNRIDFVGTEHHPRDYSNNIYHGYIQDGKSFNSNGTLIDSTISDKIAPKIADFTKVFAASTVLDGIKMTNCWTIDITRYRDGTLATIFQARADNNEMDHRFIYARFDGSYWSYSYVAKAGARLYSAEQDYTGCAALDPNNPNIIYISSSIDPRDDSDLQHYEIFKAVTSDLGKNWSWTAVTERSDCDNLRPIVPAWNDEHSALLWWRGTYTDAASFDAAVVGILSSVNETVQPMSYIDADIQNTFFADGSNLITTGPDPGPGTVDDNWHERTGFGNGGSVLTSSEMGGEDAPTLVTRVNLPDSGVYDVWVNFWVNSSFDWRIKAGFSKNNMHLYRQVSCKQVDSDEHDSNLFLTDEGNISLYQAYIGRIQVAADSTIEVFVDDEPTRTGTIDTHIGDTCRTWYDGISFAVIDTTNLVGVKQDTYNVFPEGYKLYQNYPNPFNSSTIINYSIPSTSYVTIKLYDILGKEILTLVNEQKHPGNYQIKFDGKNLSSGIYLYQMRTDHYSDIKKIVLIK